MFRIIIPTILIIVSGLTGFFYVKPAYKEMNKIKAKKEIIDGALRNVKDIRKIVSKLQDDIESISDKNVAKLTAILPPADKFDKIRFLNNLTAIAARYNLSLDGLTISEEDSDAKVAAPINFGGNGEVGVTQINFSVLASYDVFKSFLKAIEENLELLDIETFSFSPSSYGSGESIEKNGDSYTFNINLTTYTEPKQP
jgi:hypothetical protein